MGNNSLDFSFGEYIVCRFCVYLLYGIIFLSRGIIFLSRGREVFLVLRCGEGFVLGWDCWRSVLFRFFLLRRIFREYDFIARF